MTIAGKTTPPRATDTGRLRLLHLQTKGVGGAAGVAAAERGDTTAKKPASTQPKSRTEHPGFEKSEASTIARGFTAFANAIAHMTGRPVTFVLCCLVIAAWAITGPIFHYSDTWQLIINTGTTIITFLMVFLIQNTQNRDGAAVQAKLDELIRAVEGARNHFIGIEHLTEEQLEAIRAVCEQEAVAEIDTPSGKVTVIEPPVGGH